MPKINSPKGENFEASEGVKFHSLPKSGEVYLLNCLWPEGRWKHNNRLIHFCWNAFFKTYNSASPTHDEFIFMDELTVARLSAAEKFDILYGRYDYPLKNFVHSKIETKAVDWKSLSKGPALASPHHNEPVAKVLRNADGIAIPYSSSDIKALATWFYSYHYQVRGHSFGRNCLNNQWYLWNQKCESDLGPATFHQELVSKVAALNKSFLIDTQKDGEVDFSPVLAFETFEEISELDDEVPENTNKVLKIRTRIILNGGARNHSWLPMRGTLEENKIKKEYRYHLYLNSQDEIIGGKWPEDDRPEFIRTSIRESEFSGMEALKLLLND